MILSYPTLRQPGGQTLGFQIITTLALIITLLSCTIAAPPPNSNFQWAIFDEKTLYIEGGDAYGFFYSLDLTMAWDNKSPPWTALPNGPDVSSHALVVTPGETGLALFAGMDPDTATAVFDFETKTWGGPSSLISDPTLVGIRGVLNPEDGTMYFLRRGWPRLNIVFSAAVWSNLRKTILVHGGRPDEGGASMDTFFEYKPATKVWSNITTTGPSPGPSVNHCMVSAYSGTKLVVFGGYGTGNSSKSGVGSIHILDLTSMVWTAGTPADRSQNRGNPACVVVGDSFLAWGGDSNGTRASSDPIVYNLRTNQWVGYFDPIPGGTPGYPVIKKSKRAAAIGGGVAGGVVLIGLFLYYRRVRRRNRMKAEAARYQRSHTQQLRPLVPKVETQSNAQGKAKAAETSTKATSTSSAESAEKTLKEASSSMETSKDHTVVAVASE